MLTKEQRETKDAIANAIRPLQQRLDKAEKEIRRLKSGLTQTNNAVNKIKSKR